MINCPSLLGTVPVLAPKWLCWKHSCRDTRILQGRRMLREDVEGGWALEGKSQEPVMKY